LPEVSRPTDLVWLQALMGDVSMELTGQSAGVENR